MSKNSVIVLLLIALCALAVLALPGQFVSLIDARTDMVTAEGHKALDLAAAEAIKANARQVDTVTTGLALTQVFALVIPCTFTLAVVGLIAVLYVSLRDKNATDYYG